MTDQARSYDQQTGQQLRNLRHDYVLKQSQVAERLGVQPAAITRWENGTRSMTVETLLRIADLFGVRGYVLLPPQHQPPAESDSASALDPVDEFAARIATILRQRPDLANRVLNVLNEAIGGDMPTDLSAMSIQE
jgi:transcriptional regulator with XRE-family HTH domain